MVLNDREFLQGLAQDLNLAARPVEHARLWKIIDKMPITHFRGEYRWLSNFYASPVVFRGRTWKTNEHAYQAAKAKFGEEEDRIFDAATPGEAKKLGRIVHLRDGWDRSVSIRVMHDLTLAKFSQNEELKKKLLDTGDARLIEGNDWGDAFWGVPEGEVGQNILGKILMQVRNELRGKQDTSITELLSMYDRRGGELTHTIVE